MSIDKYIRDMDEKERQVAISNIYKEEDNLRTVYLNAAERIIKSLFVVNAGGTGTVLAYLHNMNVESKFLTAALFIFLVGLLLSFALTALDFLMLYDKMNQYQTDITHFFSNKIPFLSIKKFSMHEVRNARRATMIMGLVSGVCALIGMILAAVGYVLV